ncbi:30S ribosomal protein S24e [Candidatus Woesearchaeota archaeon]|nr:30S ribosomal protein S24e [Candidatus Woesearchaeota archaeon]
MELKIAEQKQNVFFSRTEIKAQLLYEGKTPSIPEIRKALASQLKKEESLVIVKNIFTKFGSNTAVVEAAAYSKKEDLEKAEPKYSLSRQAGKKADKTEKSAEKPAEEAKK